MSIETIREFGVLIPDRAKHGRPPLKMADKSEAENFVQFHPECSVVTRTITYYEWSPY